MLSAAITQYVYVTCQLTPLKEMLFRYSQIERVKTVDEIRHPIIREALQAHRHRRAQHRDHQHRRHSGRDRARLVGQLHDLPAQGAHKHKRHFIHPARAGRDGLPHRARSAEGADRQAGPVHRRVRRRDGVRVSARTGRSTARPLSASATRARPAGGQPGDGVDGFYRAAGQVLKEQDDRSKKNDQAMIDNLHFVKELGYRSLEAIEAATSPTSGA